MAFTAECCTKVVSVTNGASPSSRTSKTIRTSIVGLVIQPVVEYGTIASVLWSQELWPIGGCRKNQMFCKDFTGSGLGLTKVMTKFTV